MKAWLQISFFSEIVKGYHDVKFDIDMHVTEGVGKDSDVTGVVMLLEKLNDLLAVKWFGYVLRHTNNGRKVCSICI